jgi:hypothetical protein
MAESSPNDLFLGLVAQLQMSAWVQLGKIMHPMTGKVERNLPQAKELIDLLGVLDEKTRGNQHPEETKLFTQMLYELRLNYVEELKASAAAPASAAATGNENPAAAEAAGSSPEPNASSS